MRFRAFLSRPREKSSHQLSSSINSSLPCGEKVRPNSPATRSKASVRRFRRMLLMKYDTTTTTAITPKMIKENVGSSLRRRMGGVGLKVGFEKRLMHQLLDVVLLVGLAIHDAAKTD